MLSIYRYKSLAFYLASIVFIVVVALKEFVIRLLAFDSLLILLLDRNLAQIPLSHPLRHGLRHLLSTTIISDTGRRWHHL